MKKFLMYSGIFTIVFGIACLTGEIIGCFLTPLDGILYYFGTTSHKALGFLLNLPMYLIAAGVLITAISFMFKSKTKGDENKVTLNFEGLGKMGKWKKRRTIFQLGVLTLILIHIILTIFQLTDIRGICPRSLGDLAQEGIAGISAIFWSATIVLAFLWGRVLCGWLCVYAPVQENSANFLTSIGLNPIKKKFIQRGLIYVITPIFWSSIIFMFVKTAQNLNFNINNGDRVSDLWLYVGGLITMFPLTVFFTHFLGNRYFCKYVCPIGGLLSLIAKFSPLKVKIDHDKCIQCGVCTKNCQMSVNIDKYITNGDSCIRDGNCINCGDCIDKCPKKALKFGIKSKNLSVTKELRTDLNKSQRPKKEEEKIPITVEGQKEKTVNKK